MFVSVCVCVRLIFYGQIHFCYILPYFPINISLYVLLLFHWFWVYRAVATVAAVVEAKYYLTKNGAHKFLCEYSGKLSIYMHFTTFLWLYHTFSTHTYSRIVWNIFFLLCSFTYSINGTSAFSLSFALFRFSNIFFWYLECACDQIEYFQIAHSIFWWKKVDEEKSIVKKSTNILNFLESKKTQRNA